MVLSAADIEDSFKNVHTLKYMEEICYNGTVNLKASSSGSDIGACNWTIRCPNTTMAFISNSMFGSTHALEFDHHALQGNGVILYTDCLSSSAFEHVDSDRTSAATNNPPSLRYLLQVSEVSDNS